MALKLITPPAVEVVTLTQAKNHARVDLNDDDTLITSLITVARQQAEEFTRRALITQTWDLQMDVADDLFEIPRPPLQSVSGIFVTDDDGNETTVDPTIYIVDMLSEPGRVALATGDTWDFYRSFSGFRVRFVAGYGDTAGDVPGPIQQAILQIIGHLYENRESQDIPPLAMKLLEPYKVWSL